MRFWNFIFSEICKKAILPKKDRWGYPVARNNRGDHIDCKRNCCFFAASIVFFVFLQPEVIGGKEHTGCGCPETAADGNPSAKHHQSPGKGHQPAGQSQHPGRKMLIFHSCYPPQWDCPDPRHSY